ncbi:MAG: RNA polymerase sigma factor [Tunicatimonas sp.]|uniref:RNA polymerase sigma factor n=1 Tax=Tunicatimonas sp. TaxID=1940096 RepID=UPI003C707245
MTFSGGKVELLTDMSDLPVLWEELRLGKHASFEKVYHLTFPQLYQYGCKITSSDLVEEAIQELFITIWNNRDKIPQVSYPVAYLFRALRNRLLNQISAKKTHQVVSLDQLPDFNYQLRDETQKDEQSFALQEAINKLSFRQREVIYLLYFNDLSASEVAEALSLKVRTVYNTAHSAMESLRAHLDKESLLFYLIPVSILCLFAI